MYFYICVSGHLRTAQSYLADKNAYSFEGLGSAVQTFVTLAEQNGNVLILEYNVADGTDVRIARGRLFIQVDGEAHKYLSNEIEWMESV